MRINHNLPALNTYRQLTSNQAASVKSTEKLSSGLRINRAGDDAAGLAISEKMRGQIRGLDQASRNSQDAISMIQTAEGALNETHDILQRMRELSVQASTDTNTSSDRGEIQKEINSLTSEINRIGNTTEFNTQKLLNGDKSNTTLGITNGIVSTAGVSLSGITAAGSGKVILASGNTLAAGKDYSLVVSGTAFTGSSQGVQLGNGATGADTKLTYTGVIGNNPTFSGNAITINSGASGSIFSGNNQSGNFTLTRTDSGSIRVQISGMSGGAFGSGVDINELITADASGKFTYSSYGFEFNISDVAGFGSGDTISGNIGSGVASIGTSKVLWNSTNVSGATSAGAKLTTSSVASLGNYKVTIDTSATSVSGSIKIQMSGTDGTNIVLDTLSGIDFTADFIYSGNGISIAFSGLNRFSGTTSNTLDFSVTGTEYTASLKDGATTLGSSKIGVVGASGLAQTVSANIGGINLAISGGATITSGTNTIAVRGTAAETAKSGESSVTFQIGANQNQSMALEISDMRSNALGITRTSVEGSVNGFTSGSTVSNGTNNTNTEFALDVSTAANAANAITVIQSAIDKVSSERSKLGAYQNRLEHTINNLGTSSENLTASESRIRDVDMAKEMMNNTRNNILQQAAQAMLAQANQAPQQVLQLLR